MLFELIYTEGSINIMLNGKDIQTNTSTYIDLHHIVWIFDGKVVLVQLRGAFQ